MPSGKMRGTVGNGIRFFAFFKLFELLEAVLLLVFKLFGVMGHRFIAFVELFLNYWRPL